MADTSEGLALEKEGPMTAEGDLTMDLSAEDGYGSKEHCESESLFLPKICNVNN